MINLPCDMALYNLGDRAPGSPCDGSPHDEYYCGQITLGRDVSEYRPDIRARREADVRAARVRAEPGLLAKLLRRAEGGGFA